MKSRSLIASSTILVLSTIAFIPNSFADTIDWTGNANSSWSETNNWNTNALPTHNDDVQFTNGANNFDVTIDTNAAANSLSFNSSTPYTLTIDDNKSLTLANGITVAAGSAAPTINNNWDLFLNGGTASSVTINDIGYGYVYFNNSASAGSATINNMDNGHVYFDNNASAGSAIINNTANGDGSDVHVYFDTSANAGDAKINNTTNGNNSFANVNFDNNTSASNAKINNTANGDNSQAFINFFNSATAGNATIENTANNGDNSFAYIYFDNSATAGNATLINNSPNTFIFFDEDSSATTIGDPTIINNAGTVAFGGGLAGKTLTFAALSGTGADAQIDIAGITLQVGDSNTNTVYNGIISGTNGNFIKDGTGTLTLNGINTYTGGTSVLSGTLQIGDAAHATATIQGNIVVNSGATLTDYGIIKGNIFSLGTINLASAVTPTAYDGIIVGSGNVNKIGAGTFTLNGESTYTGNTDIQNGTLVIGDAAHDGASVTSNVTIDPAGTLEGYGTIKGDVNNVGTISPGGENTTAKLTITGNYVQQAGGTYLARNDSQGNGDQLIIQGNANLNGSLDLSALNDFAINHTYTFLTANSITGKFNQVIDNSPFFTHTVNYGSAATAPTSISYVMNYNATAFHQAAQTHNQNTVANNILAYGSNADAINGAINVTATNDEQFRKLMDQFSGATYANQTVALGEIGNWFDTQLDNHSSTISLLPANDPTLWVSAQAGYDQLLGGDVSGLATHSQGVAIGSDVALSNKTTVGAALGLTNFNETATDQEIASANGNLYQLGAYIHHAMKNWRLGAELSYGFTDNVDTKRTIQDGTANAVTTGNYHANVWSARGNVGYVIPLPSANYHVQPFAGVIGQRVTQSNFTENSNTGFELAVDPKTYQSLRSQLGVSADTTPFGSTNIQLFTNLSWEHEFADTRGEFNANFVGVGGSFNIAGTDIGRDAAAVQAGIKLPVYNKAFDLTASYQGRFANNLRENLGLLQASYNFN